MVNVALPQYRSYQYRSLSWNSPDDGMPPNEADDLALYSSERVMIPIACLLPSVTSSSRVLPRLMRPTSSGLFDWRFSLSSKYSHSVGGSVGVLEGSFCIQLQMT